MNSMYGSPDPDDDLRVLVDDVLQENVEVADAELGYAVILHPKETMVSRVHGHVVGRRELRTGKVDILLNGIPVVGIAPHSRLP
jgi:hypothetical protein